MKKIGLTIILILAVIAFPERVLGQVSSTIANIGIDANVIAPISISNTSLKKLNFGTITRSSSSGSITVTPDGQRSVTGGASALGSSSFSAAPFTVSGENSASFSITLPASGVLLTREGGTETMEVNAFTHDSGLVLSSNGEASFSVGATLNIDADQLIGEYHGSFSITVNYQ